MSLVVRGGPDGYACYSKGNEHIFNDAGSTFGYTDRMYIFTQRSPLEWVLI